MNKRRHSFQLNYDRYSVIRRGGGEEDLSKYGRELSKSNVRTVPDTTDSKYCRRLKEVFLF